MISPQFVNTCMACTIPFDNNTISTTNTSDTVDIPNTMDNILDSNNIIQSIQTIPNTIIINTYQEQYPTQKRFKTKRLKQAKFNTKKYHNIHQPGRTNCDQRSRI